jgi:hypothetical protein
MSKVKLKMTKKQYDIKKRGIYIMFKEGKNEKLP